MTLSRSASDYQAGPSITQKVRERDMEMQDVADTIESGEIVHHDPSEGYAVIEGEILVGIMEVNVRLHLSTDSEPVAEINRMEIINE